MNSHYFLLKNKQSLHYTTWGNPENPAVVCVHGLTRNARDFDYLAHYLSDKNNTLPFYVVCIDILGRGKSDWASQVTDYSITNYTNQIIQWLDALQLHCPHWIGTSMGGLIAMALQLIQPNRLGKIVLNDIGPVIEYKGLQQIAQYIGSTMYFNTREEAHAYARRMFVGFGPKTSNEWTGLCEHYFVNNNQDTQAVRVHYDPLIATATKQYVDNLTNDKIIKTQSDLWDAFNSFQLPICVLRGEYSDLLSAETLLNMQKNNPRVSSYTIADCGHAPHLMNTEQAKIIFDFLSV